MNKRKPLQQCRSETERRENYPQLCRIADLICTAKDPEQTVKAVAWIIRQRRLEFSAATEAAETDE